MPEPKTRRPGECVVCAALPYKPTDPSPGELELYGPEFRPVRLRSTDNAPRKPRCATHKRAERKRASAATHDAYVGKAYGVSRGFYAQLREAQGGRCAICRRATGETKRLAVDHNHRTGDVRGLLCGPCNSLLAHCRDDVEMLRRAARYLVEPPAAALLIAADEDVA